MGFCNESESREDACASKKITIDGKCNKERSELLLEDSVIARLDYSLKSAVFKAQQYTLLLA